MKRGAKRIVQTINLSDPKTCLKPTVQKFVKDYDSTDRVANRGARSFKVGTQQGKHRKYSSKVGDDPCSPYNRVHARP